MFVFQLSLQSNDYNNLIEFKYFEKFITEVKICRRIFILYLDLAFFSFEKGKRFQSFRFKKVITLLVAIAENWRRAWDTFILFAFLLAKYF